MMTQFIRTVVLGLLCAGALGLSATCRSQAVAAKTACLPEHKDASAQVGQYLFQTYRNQDGDGACLQVMRQDKVIFERTMDGGAYTLGQAGEKDADVPAIANGIDITGRGHPNMIVSFYTGGAHCCVSHYVFELEPQFLLLDTIDSEHGDLAHFIRIGSRYYMDTNDWTFAYWHTSFVSSPAPDIWLVYKGDRFHLDFDRMRKPAPTASKWAKILQESHKAFPSDNKQKTIESDLWGNMLVLIYTGHSELAWKLFDTAWPKQRAGKDIFLRQFCSQLKTSPYWGDLEKTLTNVPAVCVQAKPKRDDEE